VSAGAIRAGGRDRDYPSGLVAAMLDVIDGYEAVEVRPNSSVQGTLYTKGAAGYSHDSTCFTIYMKKPVPEPTVEELAQDAVDAWLRDRGSRARTMNALAAKLSKQGR